MTTTNEQELVALEREWMESILRKDIEAFERILAPDYVYTATGQGRWSRQQWLEAVPNYDLRHLELVDADVRTYGDTAVILCRFRQDAIVAGARRSGDFLVTDVWVKRDESWQVVARSSSQSG